MEAQYIYIWLFPLCSVTSNRQYSISILEVIPIFSQHGSSCVAEHGNSFTYHKLIYFDSRLPIFRPGNYSPSQNYDPFVFMWAFHNFLNHFFVYILLARLFEYFFPQVRSICCSFCKHSVLFISSQSATD